MDSIKTLLRWVAVIPAAIIAASLAWLLTGSIDGALGYDQIGASNWILIELVGAFAASIVFVHAGAHVAPRFEDETAFVLVGIGAVAGVWLTASSIANDMMRPALVGFTFLAGIAYSGYTVARARR